MKILDFDNTKPDFVNGDFKWYIDKYFQKYITTEQAENLPKLENLMCFVVKGPDVQDYVLINSKQEILAGYSYPHEFEEMEAKINIMKISKHFDNYENDIQ